MSDPIDTPRPSAAGPPSEVPLASFFAANGGMFDGGAVDDAPTIISKAQPRSPRPEDTFAHTLRGRRLAHFDLIEPIGVGGMAAVIRAQDTQLDRSVALKILPPDMAADPENIRRFQQEARAAAKLDHENIARVYYFGEDQGLHFIAFEFVEGENLRLLLEHRGRLLVPEAVHYMLQIATGLAHAAERGVVHRDIKPSNIIIGPSGRAKLVDMGLARSMAPVGDIELTQSGVTLGTFDYISPEQALEPRLADVRSDIYSLGCTFYQALTGQPPVPEGTAAKKLHHHQHVAPLDPRQMNSAVPDELAAILGRMMAKDPRERYQRPEHLVQHLLQLAQKLGAGGQGADGVLFVDAPLPSPPRMRPMIVAAVAASLLVMLVVLHGMSSWPSSRTTPGFATRPKDSGPRTSENTDVVKSPNGVDTTPRPVEIGSATGARAPIPVASAQELALALATRTGDLDIVLREDFELVPTRGIDPGARVPEMVFAGSKRELRIHSERPGKRATLKLTFNADLRAPDTEGTPVWLPLSFEGGRITFSGVRFEVDAREAPHLMIAPIRLRQGAGLTLENCEFVQRRPPGMGRMADVVVEGAAGRDVLPSVTAKECSFVSDVRSRTAEAISLSGAARVALTNCAFGPHAAVVHSRERASEAADIRMTGCSALLTDGAVFQIDELGGRFLVQHSLFSRPTSPDELPVGGGVLIRQEGSGSVDSFTGQRNRYHNLSALWARSPEQPPLAEDLEHFRAVPGVKDADSAPLDVSPWADKDPLRALESGDLIRAFRADARSADLRQASRDKMIGITWDKLYPTLPPLDERRQLVVDPSTTVGSDASVKIFSKLEQAVLEARPGEEILVRVNGILSVEPIRLDKPSVDLTIRPFGNSHPVLELGESPDKDVSMFRLQDGKLKLDGLEFRLKPRAREGKDEMQAVIGIAGQGHCQFKKCVFTLGSDSGGDNASLSVVALADPKDVMKMGTPAPRPMPEVFFENCFARGRGSFISVRASRPFELRADNCIAALNGSFCNVEASTAKELPTAAAQITLTRLTGVFSGNLLQLHTAREAKDLVPVIVRASESIFSASAGQPLVHIDGEVSQVTKRTLTWEGRRNVYLNFKQLLDQSKGEENTMGAFNKDKWVAFTNEGDALFEGVRFLSVPPTADRALLDTVPQQFRLKAEEDAELRAGADPSRLLTPAPRGRAAPVSAADGD